MKVIIIDDFLDKPEEARKLGIQAKQNDILTLDDLYSDQEYDRDLVDALFSDITGEKIVSIDSKYKKYNMYLKHETYNHVHYDEADYIALIYLNKEYRETDGVSFYLHKETGVKHASELEIGTQLGEDIEANKENFDLNKWEEYMFINAKYNRLVLFEPLYYHGASLGFGETLEEGRLAEVLHFVKEDNLKYWIRILYGKR